MDQYLHHFFVNFSEVIMTYQWTFFNLWFQKTYVFCKTNGEEGLINLRLLSLLWEFFNVLFRFKL